MKKNSFEKRKETIKNSLKQISLFEETETHIVIDYQDKKLRLYTNRATVMNRLERAGYKHIKQDIVDGQVYSRNYVFETSEIGKFLRTSIFKFD